MKLEDLTGRRFCNLTVTHRWTQVGDIAKWHCICDCGRTSVVAAHHLKSGETSSCGCRRLRRALDLIGKRFHRLMVIARAPNIGEGAKAKSRWECRCECGRTAFVAGYALRNGNTKSCGCLVREVSAKHAKRLNRTHGMYGTRVHTTWSSMIQRCQDPNHNSFKDYGGRGIRVCERWQKFENFLADMGEPPPGKTLDRKHVNGNYEPGNCRWATAQEQAENRRDNFKINAFGQYLTVAAWARATGLSKAAIIYRLAKGMSPEEAVGEPPKKNGSKQRAFVPPRAA